MNIKHIGITLLAVAVVVIVSLTVYYNIGGKLPTPWNENETVSGAWNEDVILTYSDGTNDSLNSLLASRDRPFSVQYLGMDVVSITYIISASSTGTEFTTCNVDISSFSIHKTVSDNVYAETETYSGAKYLTVNGGQETLCSTTISIDDVLYGHPSGEYTVSFTPTGSIIYRGENGYDSDWYTATLPSGCSIVVDNLAGSITLNIGDSYTWT